jgi:hypothetical protein
MSEDLYETLPDLGRLHQAAGDENTLVVISLLLRKRVEELVARVENELYPPGTPANDLFQLYFLQWPESAPLQWFIFTMPWQDEKRVRELAGELGFRLNQGVPVVYSGGQANIWPVRQSARTFTIEGGGE